MVRGRSATSTDVARRAGVSQATVSVVLNGARSTIRVSHDTRQRVLAAARGLGYAPNQAAQALRRRRSGIIGFLPRLERGEPFAHPIHYLLSIHAARAAADRGYQLVEAGVEADALRDSEELVRFLVNRRVDGVIFDGPKTAGEVRRILDYGLPAIQILRPQETVATPTITVDPGPGIDAAVDHLVALGQRAIAFLGRNDPHPVDRRRLNAYTAAIARHGLARPAHYVRLCDGGYCLENGYALTRELLSLRRWPTAIFAASDSFAIGAAHALYEAGVRVPDAMSLISYDDTLASQLYPPLTSVAQPFAAIAERAIALVAQLIEQTIAHADEPERIILPTQLKVRRSTAPPEVGRASDGVTGGAHGGQGAWPMA